MLPIKFKGYTKIIAENQEPYLPLPVYADSEQGGRVFHCWQLGWKERFKIFFSGKLWIYVLNFGEKLQPIKPMADNPFESQG